jgi:NAD+ kinase
MKTFKIFLKNDEKSTDVAADLHARLLATGKFREVGEFSTDSIPCSAKSTECSTNCPLDGTPCSEMANYVISVGGDGCFLRSFRKSKVADDVNFVGVNTGTLGFLQSVKPEALDSLVQSLLKQNYRVQKLSFIKCTVTYKNGEESVFNCLNELVVRDEWLHILNLKIRVDGEDLETFAGDGVLVATSTGSTAYNLSLGGSIVHERFHTLQLTPIAPLTTIAHSLSNSLVMPEGSCLEISPAARTQDLLLCTDGHNTVIRDVKSLKVELDKRRVNRIIIDGHSFWQRINEKILRRGN